MMGILSSQSQMMHDHSCKIGLLLLLLLLFIHEISTECIDDHACVPFDMCTGPMTSLVYKCENDNGGDAICCPRTQIRTRADTFPQDCGAVWSGNRISGGQEAEHGQFPWMALLGYRQRSINITQFLCGGTVITENYVLTAAHCIRLDSRLELTVVRFGEHDLSTPIDCYEFYSTKICADPHLDINVARALPHPRFDSVRLTNDIGLVRLHRPLTFTEFIRPICLPFTATTAPQSDANLTVAGWGKTDPTHLGGSTRLQYAFVRAWDVMACERAVPPDVRPIGATRLCANGANTEDACKGDSGGPLMEMPRDMPRYYQIGIVSFASTLTCGNPKLPTIYTRVDKYLDWIVESMNLS